jgi:hypothetical protein
VARLICAAVARQTSLDRRVAGHRICCIRGLTPRSAAVPSDVGAVMFVGSGESRVADVVRPISALRLEIKIKKDEWNEHKLRN